MRSRPPGYRHTKIRRILEKKAGEGSGSKPTVKPSGQVHGVISAGDLPLRFTCDAVNASFLPYCVGYKTPFKLLLKLSSNLITNYPLMLGRKTTQYLARLLQMISDSEKQV